MGKHEITQEFLKEHFEYRDGHLWRIKSSSNKVKVGQRFGSYASEGYIFELENESKQHD